MRKTKNNRTLGIAALPLILILFAYFAFGCSAPTVVVFNSDTTADAAAVFAATPVPLTADSAAYEQPMIKIVITDVCDTAIQYPDTGVESANEIVMSQVLPYLEYLVRRIDANIAPREDGGRLSRIVVFNMRLTPGHDINISFIEETETGYSFLQSFDIDITNPNGAKLIDDLRQIVPATEVASLQYTLPVTGKKRIALTFDDGPSVYTPEILAALRASNAKATFCVIGSRVAQYSATIAEAAAQGCEVIGHTWDHPDLTKLSNSDIKWEINRTTNAIEKVTGIRTTIYRPPYGSYNTAVRKVSADLNMSLLIWSLDTEDWMYLNEERLYNFVMDNAKDGAIILCHDIYKTTKNAAMRFIPELVKRGFVLVTASELLEQDGAALVMGKPYFGEY